MAEKPGSRSTGAPMLIRIESRYPAPWVVGVVVEGGRVVRAAPSAKYMIGWPEDRVWTYIRSRRDWRASLVRGERGL